MLAKALSQLMRRDFANGYARADGKLLQLTGRKLAREVPLRICRKQETPLSSAAVSIAFQPGIKWPAGGTGIGTMVFGTLPQN